ncbi:MAG: hypothetical protein M1816_004025 [Peltula sp. TS41687]|nr:MAG: hypothetical protein M1816_004025 [Peltula sp. TS41687]
MPPRRTPPANALSGASAPSLFVTPHPATPPIAASSALVSAPSGAAPAPPSAPPPDLPDLFPAPMRGALRPMCVKCVRYLRDHPGHRCVRVNRWTNCLTCRSHHITCEEVPTLLMSGSALHRSQRTQSLLPRPLLALACWRPCARKGLDVAGISIRLQQQLVDATRANVNAFRRQDHMVTIAWAPLVGSRDDEQDALPHDEDVAGDVAGEDGVAPVAPAPV